ncbi:hypothetical protein ACWD0A_03645 [Streptomyces sp. NPDC002867]
MSSTVESGVASAGLPQAVVGVVTALTVVPHRATLLRGGVHLALLAA